MGDEFVDLSNIYEIADKIQMEMPYAGDRESFIENLCMYSTGDITDRNSYLCRFFGYKCV